jgi:hypothetical protein
MAMGAVSALESMPTNKEINREGFAFPKTAPDAINCGSTRALPFDDF